MMATETKSRRLSEAGRRGGQASLETMTPDERSARAKAAASARWGRPSPERVVSKMVVEIYRSRRPMSLFRRDQSLWFSAPDHIEAPRWQDYLVGTYDIGVLEEDVLADVAASW